MTTTVETAVLHSLSAVALVVAMTACEPSLPQDPPTGFVVAVFDPTASQIPLPNDLAFLAPVNASCPPPHNTDPGGPACAQAELLASFAGQFPGDQEVPITIDFVETVFDDKRVATRKAPDLDLSTFTSSTVFVFAVTPYTQTEMPLEPFMATDYVKAADNSHGTLTIHNKGRVPWPAASYALVMRGGPSGVKTTSGPIVASSVFNLVAQGLDMTDPANLGLLKAQTGSTAAALELGGQLNLLIALYNASAFPVADRKFPHQELAIATTFRINATPTNIPINAATGQVPLPIDLLRDPTTGKLSALAACTLAGSTLSANGTCPNPAAAGFQALDGFSTTGAILGPTSDLVRATTVTPTSVLLFDLSDAAHPVQVPPASLIIEPCEFTSACGSPTALSPVIAIQPAGATAGDATSVFRTRPLKDNTNYAVVVMNTVLDKAGNPLGSGTAAKILKISNPIVVGGHSALLGVDDATAGLLEPMRGQLAPVLAGLDRSKVAIAYTFHTQTILSQANQLAALPYIKGAPTALPGTVTASTAADAFTKFGVVPQVPSSNIDEILEVDITTFNALDPITGAFLANPLAAANETIHVLIATPQVANPNIPACAGGLAGFGKCAPLMVFRHGLGRGRADMLLIADSYAAAGMATVAIDAAKHGDRSFCTSGATGAASGCNGGATCTTALPSGAQGDVNPPGTCGVAGFFKAPVTPGATGNTDGIPAVSGNYLVTANFFRTRDSLRQDAIDQSQLVRAIAFVPSGAPPTGHSVFDHMVQRGVIIDPATIYFSGQSLGAIQGAMDVASNPRISKAGFNVGGGTLVDVFTTSPAFAPQVDQLLAGLGIVRGTAGFLQFLVVAKTVLDPADPINFVGHLTGNTLPNLLANPNGSVPQANKKILSQMANCDGVVPNPFGYVYASNVPTTPLPPTGATGTFELFVSSGFVPNSCASGTVEHGFLLDFAAPALTLQAQSDVANFVMHDTLPPSVQH